MVTIYVTKYPYSTSIAIWTLSNISLSIMFYPTNFVWGHMS